MTTAVGDPSVVGRRVALVLRPCFIFFHVTMAAALLLAVATGDVGLADYGDWLNGFLPLGADLAAAFERSAQVWVGATVVGIAVGTGLGVALRRRWGRHGGGLLVPALSFTGPVLAPALLYLLTVRVGAFPATGAPLIGDDLPEALRHLVLPALVAGLPLAPAVAALVLARPEGGERVAVTAAAAGAASRAEAGTGAGWRFGFPAGVLVAGSMVADVAFARAGLTTSLLAALDGPDPERVLDVIGLFALVGAVLALVIDLAGFRRPRSSVTDHAGPADAARAILRPWPGYGLIAGVALGVAAIVAGAGFGAGSISDNSAASLLAPGNGAFLGTDALGRDLARLAAVGIGPALAAAALPSLVATGAAVGLARLQRRSGPVGHVIPGAIVDGLWWPVPVAAVIAVGLFGDLADTTAPAVLAVMAVTLIPFALRVVQRSDTVREPLGIAGSWLLVAAAALTAHLVAGFVLAVSERPETLGGQIRAGTLSFEESVWPALVPAALAAIALLGLNGVGGFLTQLSRYRISDGTEFADAFALAESLPTAGRGSRAAIDPDDAYLDLPALDDADLSELAPDDDLDDYDPDDRDLDDRDLDGGDLDHDDRRVDDPDEADIDLDDYDGPIGPDGPLLPNYDLQPGMPRGALPGTGPDGRRVRS